MMLLKKVDEVISALKKSETQKAHALTSTKYKDSLVFNCGCKSKHRVNDPNNKIISVALPAKFCFLCENMHVTFVQVKGFFSQEATTIWTCSSKLFGEAMVKLGHGEAMQKGYEKGVKNFFNE